MINVAEPVRFDRRLGVESLEVDLVVNAINERYGFDFSNYSRLSLTRRLMNRVRASGMRHLSELVPRLIHDEAFFATVLKELSVTVTELFRDPTFYAALRDYVFPRLRTYPFINIWHAGCATGEEVYSMAIALKEAGLYDRARIYGTDYNNQALRQARAATYSLERIREGTANYNQSGGNASLADYYQVDRTLAHFRDDLKQNVTFANHNLTADRPFGEMHLVICRNVMIYFNRRLQNSVHRLFTDSLCSRGFLGLGTKETLEYSESCDQYCVISSGNRIYQKTS